MAATNTTFTAGDALFGRLFETARQWFETETHGASAPHSGAELHRVMSDGQLRDIGLDRQALAQAHERPVIDELF